MKPSSDPPLARPLGAVSVKPPTGISIAIVGTEGAGKTVLTTCLAKGFQNRNSDGVWLEPLTGATARYVEQVWATLENYEWPPSTPPGQLFNLQWRLHLGDGLVSELRLIDAAGQDLRLLFAEEKIQAVDQLPEQFRQLAQYVRGADIVLFLVNLKDFAGEGDAEKRIGNQWALKYAMDYLSENPSPRRFLLVFSQIDLYRAYAQQLGHWGKVVERYLPYVYEAYLSDGRVRACGVSAVNATQVIQDGDGIARRVPADGFKSEGFSSLTKWIVENARQLHEDAGQPQREKSREQAAALRSRIVLRLKYFSWFRRGLFLLAPAVYFSGLQVLKPFFTTDPLWRHYFCIVFVAVYLGVVSWFIDRFLSPTIEP